MSHSKKGRNIRNKHNTSGPTCFKLFSAWSGSDVFASPALLEVSFKDILTAKWWPQCVRRRHDVKLLKHLLWITSFKAYSFRCGSDCRRRSESFPWSGNAVGVPAAVGRKGVVSLWYSTRHSRGLPRTPQVPYCMPIHIWSPHAGMGESLAPRILWRVTLHMTTMKCHRIKTEIINVIGNICNNRKGRYFRHFISNFVLGFILE